MAKFYHQNQIAWLFIVPQLVVVALFFIWPSLEALIQAFYYSDAFNLHRQFAGLSNFTDLFINPGYLHAVLVTWIMVFFITLLTMSFGITLAYLVHQRKKAQTFYKILLIWPYAVAPAVAAILWRFLCHPNLGWVTELLQTLGFDFNIITNASSALVVIILAASWQQFSYNFLFYYAGLQGIPLELTEAAMLDGASSWKRFWQIIVPLLSPTTFFLMIMNLIYAFFETFGIISVITHGGPGNSTTNMIYKVYEDGFIGMDAGSSSAQSVLLMTMVVALTLLQFKYLEKKVHYA